MNYLYYLQLIPLAIGLFVSFRYRKLSSSMPLLTAGFGLLIFSSLANLAWMLFIAQYLKFSQLSLPGWIWIFSAITAFLSFGGWTMLTAGLGLVLKDVGEKLAFWEEASQNGWRFGANNANQNTGQIEGLGNIQEAETPRSAFVPPSAQSHNFQPYITPRVEHKEVIIPLGSSHS